MKYSILQSSLVSRIFLSRFEGGLDAGEGARDEVLLLIFFGVLGWWKRGRVGDRGRGGIVGGL